MYVFERVGLHARTHPATKQRGMHVVRRSLPRCLPLPFSHHRDGWAVVCARVHGARVFVCRGACCLPVQFTWMEQFAKLPRALREEFHESTRIYDDEIRPPGAGEYFRLTGLVIP